MCKTPQHKSLLLRKGVYPYEWTESVSQLQEAKELTEKEAFYSSLSEQHMSDKDYEHAKKV